MYNEKKGLLDMIKEAQLMIKSKKNSPLKK